MNVPSTVLHGAIRLSFSHENTEDDVDRVLEVLPGIIAKLRAMAPSRRDEPAAGS
jgi:cysteine desulfurase